MTVQSRFRLAPSAPDATLFDMGGATLLPPFARVRGLAVGGL
ncbi:hypothetical protein [Azorhizobium oxalatiphilum]|nr:hypothetical protein [Azorhizobium oxalatiphilum]